MSVFTDKWIDEHKDELVEKLQQCVRINSVRGEVPGGHAEYRQGDGF